MKPTTDALNKWLQTMIIHPLFIQARFYKNNISDATIEWEFVPRSVNKHTSIVPALFINIFNLKKNRNDEKFVHKVLLSIKTPDIFIANTDIHDKEWYIYTQNCTMWIACYYNLFSVAVIYNSGEPFFTDKDEFKEGLQRKLKEIKEESIKDRIKSLEKDFV